MGGLGHILLPGLTRSQHPGSFGYSPADASPASILGDLPRTGLGVLGLSRQASPALTELEWFASDWMRRVACLSDTRRGVIQVSASSARWWP